jgi:hypothetical protein
MSVSQAFSITRDHAAAAYACHFEARAHTVTALCYERALLVLCCHTHLETMARQSGASLILHLTAIVLHSQQTRDTHTGQAGVAL